jgi:hypothetical protein
MPLCKVYKNEVDDDYFSFEVKYGIRRAKWVDVQEML